MKHSKKMDQRTKKRTSLPLNSSSRVLEALADEDKKIERALHDQNRPRPGGKLTPRKVVGDKPRCGAKTRSGRPCASFTVGLNGRCRMHGGTSTGPPKGCRNALKHGIYSQILTDEDRDVFERAKIGTVDDELKIARIRLRRALAEQTRQESSSDLLSGLELAEITTNTIAGRRIADVKRVRRDYRREIHRLLRLIGDLELKRAQLETLNDLPGTAEEIAAKIRAALDEADAMSAPPVPAVKDVAE